jgi:hypothetical protein
MVHLAGSRRLGWLSNAARSKQNQYRNRAGADTREERRDGAFGLGKRLHATKRVGISMLVTNLESTLSGSFALSPGPLHLRCCATIEDKC